MEAQQQATSTAEKELFVKMVVSAWEAQNIKLDNMLANLSDEQFLSETAPGRNTGIYLLGHSIAVNDALFPLLGFGKRLYPQLDAAFITRPDKSGNKMPPLAELKAYWANVNAELMKHINNTSTDEWFSKHNNILEEDFVKEPHRNKLNILINRANHQSYHLGQLAYLTTKA